MSTNIIAPLLAKLYNQSIIKETFSSILKIAQIVPIYKNGPKEKSLKNVFMNNCTLTLLNTISSFGLPFNQGLPWCMMLLYNILFSMSFSITPTSPISSFTTSRNLLFDLLLFLFLGKSISITLLSTFLNPIYLLLINLDSNKTAPLAKL